jgi:hypothetical protein
VDSHPKKELETVIHHRQAWCADSWGRGWESLGSNWTRKAVQNVQKSGQEQVVALACSLENHQNDNYLV